MCNVTIKIPWRGKTIRNYVTQRSTHIKVAIFGMTIAALCTSFARPALADTLDDKITALRTQVAQQQSDAANLHADANSAAARVTQLRAQSGALQSQINLNQAKYAKISATIADNNFKLDTQKVVLSANIKSMYLGGTVSPLQMLASSHNLSDFLDQQQYQDKIKTKIQEAMSEVQTLQVQLAADQSKVSQILSDQKIQQQQLAAMTAEANQLAALATQNASSADAQVRNGNTEISSLKAQQAAILAARFSGGRVSGGTPCGGGYPGWLCNAGQDSIADPWGMYNRECVSYTAFKVAASGRTMPYWGGAGNAKQWPDNARSSNIPMDGSPKAGDVAISLAGPYGHAMYVEAVNGGNIYVSQYNYAGNGTYSTMTIPASGLYFIHFR